ncbi:hypothetical protein J2046_006790 [Rhizobium petrolearium]|uniref:hypothetical protein n=1 Tax=Neorhizobium petrolearium TaxID=515361 RepID=UPI001AE8C296|nr:hypothetical protein [Neorhizobium petrolearium]MBP1848494.1 hypothetical protein [Neorhizobium petrolearium]
MAVTLNQAAAALDRHVGLPQPRTMIVARRLREAGAFPSGATGVSPILELENFLDLLIAVASACPAHKARQTVEAFKAMTPGGADLSEAPASVRATAGRQLAAIAELAIEGDADMRKLNLEFIKTWPEFAVHFDGGETQRFQPIGSVAGHWQAAGHRTSTAINGAALADALKELFA